MVASPSAPSPDSLPQWLGFGITVYAPLPRVQVCLFSLCASHHILYAQKSIFLMAHRKRPYRDETWYLAIVLYSHMVPLETREQIPSSSSWLLSIGEQSSTRKPTSPNPLLRFLQTVVPWSRMHISNKYSGSITFSPQKEN